MPCYHVGNAIVCTRRRAPRCIQCGRAADRECDWKVKKRKSGTCDAPICATCSYVPAPEKDLCPLHAETWRAYLAKRAEREPA